MESGLRADKELTEDITRLNVSDTTTDGYKRREDITDKMFAATRALAVGEVIRAPDFSFLDALGALEIMDPKTDSGMIINDDGANESTDTQHLLPEEIIWIMDQLLAREISWHSGNPLAQTLFTCTYLADSLFNFNGKLDTATFLKSLPPLQPSFFESLRAVVLRSYVLAVGKCCGSIREELQNGNIYEEEDVATNTSSLSLFDDISASEFIKLLNEALEIVETEIGKETLHSLEGIKTRLEFRLKFLEIVSGTISSTKARRSALENCINMLPAIAATMNLGKELPQAFSTRIQRKLSTQVPPRPMVTIDPKEAETSLKTLLSNLLEIECIYEYNSPHEIMNYFDYFAARNPTPFAYVRSMLQSRFNNEDIILSRDSSDIFLMQSVIDICHPQSEYFPDETTQSQHPVGPKFKITQCIQTFFDRSTPMYMDLFRIKCHNKCRQRRNLSKLVQEWESLQLDIEKIDIELLELIPQKSVNREGNGPQYAFPLCSWVYHMKLTLIETVLAMGFELELYQPYEYVLIYGYLGHSYLIHNQQLDRIKSHVHIPKRGKSQTKESFYVDFLITRNLVMENMCGAYCSLFMVLRALDLIRLPTTDKTTEYMRYTLRLKPFWGLSSPEILPFESYQETFTISNSPPLMINLLSRALEYLSIARQAIDRLNKLNVEQTRMRYCFPEFKEDIKNLMKSCIGINIFIQGLLKQTSIDTKLYAGKIVTMERKYHPWFSVVKIVDRKSRRQVSS